MSCTENESGPFVVFFLPAVVGCLTILLARRWANSQVTSTSSTAVSRRRKIIKDPLIKRPPPPVSCKMVPPGSKKSGVIKRVAFPANDEDLVTSGKRPGKSNVTRPTNGILVDTNKQSDTQVAPKHIPFPYIPQDGELLFEAMNFVFVLVATGSQFLNLYRTMWWLPYSNTSQAMNFYLIDPSLVSVILMLMSRRFIFSLGQALLKTFVSDKLLPYASNVLTACTLGLVLGISAIGSYQVLIDADYYQMLYLFYPALVYFILFGVTHSPFLELNNTSPLHCCSQDPQQIREEVETLRQDFNLRLKKILFNSMFEAYYTSFLPCCFAPNFLYYDVYAASQQVGFVWGALCGRYLTHLLSASYCDVGHRAARHVSWRTDAAPTECPLCPSWTSAILQYCGARAWCAATPDAAHQHKKHKHYKFYSLFINPSKMLCVVLCLQMSLIVVQLCLLFSNATWHNFLAIVLLLFINYYTLFKLVRDYLVAWKVYKAENMIQDKNGAVPPVVN